MEHTTKVTFDVNIRNGADAAARKSRPPLIHTRRKRLNKGSIATYLRRSSSPGFLLQSHSSQLVGRSRVDCDSIYSMAEPELYSRLMELHDASLLARIGPPTSEIFATSTTSNDSAGELDPASSP
jgi:hypothetical protein